MNRNNTMAANAIIKNALIHLNKLNFDSSIYWGADTFKAIKLLNDVVEKMDSEESETEIAFFKSHPELNP